MATSLVLVEAVAVAAICGGGYSINLTRGQAKGSVVST
jgi:hypothetical protein